ncbi:hypothetical protein PR048_021290 [Dryococelus australis]|uniref:t-SNARE coiled-coil homology domain-containing protein n=1 Tax=Dryococelus australis TaxID=614101 RepID=A0ABQ9GXV5_9NEOP|nr:hypothetical protein PR048_021290 [Dryococelus australis]
MAKQSNDSNSTSSCVDDVDDETFLRGSQYGVSGINSVDRIGALNRERQTMLERRGKLEESCIQSTQRSIGLLKESEGAGVATAEELARQRSQLERTEQRLDETDTALRSSQRHIQGMNSWFGSFKNRFSRRSGEPPTPASRIPAKNTDDLNSYTQMNRSTSRATAPPELHPGLHVRGQAPALESSTQVQAALESNLNDIGNSLTFLKGLAEGMGSDLDSQAQLIGRVTDKTETAEFKIRQQNRDMNKLLKK